MALDSKKTFAGEIIATVDILCTLMVKSYFNYILKAVMIYRANLKALPLSASGQQNRMVFLSS